MDHVCTTNMNFVSSNIIAGEPIMKTNVGILLSAKDQNFSKRDTLKLVKDTIKKKDVSLEMNVPTVMKIQ